MLHAVLLLGLIAICAQPFWIIARMNRRESVRKPLVFLEVVVFFLACLQLLLNFFASDACLSWAEVIGVVIFLVGVVLLLYGRYWLRRYSSYIPAMVFGIPKELVTDGPFGVVRHPVYSGLLCAALGFELALSSLLIVGLGVLLCLLMMQIRKEEALLYKTFGLQWIAFKQQTRYCMFPFIW